MKNKCKVLKTINYSNKLIDVYNNIVSKKINESKYFNVLVLYDSFLDGKESCGDFNSSISRPEESLDDLIMEVNNMYINRPDVTHIEIKFFRKFHTKETLQKYKCQTEVMFKKVILKQ